MELSAMRPSWLRVDDFSLGERSMNDPTYFLVVASACAVLIDAKRIGLKKGQVRGIANMAPFAWFCGCLVLWPIVFPLYVLSRSNLKRAAQQWRRLEHCAPLPGPRFD